MLEVGSIMVAVDPCIMESTGNTSLTVGKEYEVLDIDIEHMDYKIKDDEGYSHWFNIGENTYLVPKESK